MDERFIVTLDAGSSKIALSVAQITGDNLQVIYYRETPSAGIRHGGIYNPQKAAESIRAALNDAEKSLNITIHQVVLTLPRWSVRQERTTAKMELSNPDAFITQEEVDILKDIALESYPLEDAVNERIYSAVAQSFATDDQINASEDDIVGACSSKIECDYRVYIGKKKPVFNIYMAMQKAGVAISREIFAPEAVGEGVLKGSEKDNGVGLIDFGADVTSLSIYQGGILRYYNSIPFGGRSITADIAYEASIRKVLAENIKYAYGCCQPEKLQNMSDKILKIVNNDEGSDQDLKVSYLSEIITARVNEIFYAILYMIKKSGYDGKLRSGLVLTGGGANLVNCGGYLKELSGYNVRIGYPKIRQFSHDGCSGINETSAAATVGMLLLTRNDKSINCIEERQTIEEKAPESTGATSGTAQESTVGSIETSGDAGDGTSVGTTAAAGMTDGVETAGSSETTLEAGEGKSTGTTAAAGAGNAAETDNDTSIETGAEASTAGFENGPWTSEEEGQLFNDNEWEKVAPPVKPRRPERKKYKVIWNRAIDTLSEKVSNSLYGLFGDNYEKMGKADDNN